MTYMRMVASVKYLMLALVLLLSPPLPSAAPALLGDPDVPECLSLLQLSHRGNRSKILRRNSTCYQEVGPCPTVRCRAPPPGCYIKDPGDLHLLPDGRCCPTLCQLVCPGDEARPHEGALMATEVTRAKPSVLPEPWGMATDPASEEGAQHARSKALNYDLEDSLELSIGSVGARMFEVPGEEPAKESLPELCVQPSEVQELLQTTTEAVLRGLPPWTEGTPPGENPASGAAAGSAVEEVKLAFLVQVSFESKLYLVRRVFSQLYSPNDVFLYLVDARRLHPDRLREVLPNPLPENVVVNISEHAGYFYWPRVRVVLDGLERLSQHNWDFVIHLSESDYPVHPLWWIRRALAMQRHASVIELTPRCARDTVLLEDVGDSWYWWTQLSSIASCGSATTPEAVPEAPFPMAELESRGFTFARGPEWVALTRELVRYALQPELAPFRQLIGMHAAADEIFWATLVLNIPNFTHSINPRQWFIQWSSGRPGHSPDTLTEQNEDAIMANRARYLFMRKVDLAESHTLLDDVDSLSLQEQELPSAFHTSSDEWAWDGHAIPCKAI